MIPESEKIIRQEFKDLMKARDYDAALELVNNNKIPYWHQKGAHELVKLGNNLKMIEYFVANYGYKEDFSHMIRHAEPSYMDYIKYVQERGYNLTNDDLYSLFRDSMTYDVDNETMLWAGEKLKARNAMELVKNALGIAAFHRNHYSYEIFEFLFKNLPVEKEEKVIEEPGVITSRYSLYDDMVKCLFLYDDIRYVELLFSVKEKGYDFDFEKKGWIYLSNILIRSVEFTDRKCIQIDDTRPQRIEVLKRLGWKNDGNLLNQLCIALLKEETYSEELLNYYSESFGLNEIVSVYGDTLLIKALKEGKNTIAQKIIDYGADVNAGKRRGY